MVMEKFRLRNNAKCLIDEITLRQVAGGACKAQE